MIVRIILHAQKYSQYNNFFKYGILLKLSNRFFLQFVQKSKVIFLIALQFIAVAHIDRLLQFFPFLVVCTIKENLQIIQNTIMIRIRYSLISSIQSSFIFFKRANNNVRLILLDKILYVIRYDT